MSYNNIIAYYNMNWTCKYKHALGVPGKGVHKHYMGIAYMDVIGTIVIAWLIYMFVPGLKKTSLVTITIFLFVFGIILHRLFCVPTTLDKYLFNNFY